MKSTIDLELICQECKVETAYTRGIMVNVDDVEKAEILSYFNIEEIIYHFDEDKILDHIGKDRVKKYFDLKDITECLIRLTG